MKDLRERTIHAGSVRICAQAASFLIRVGSLIVLARTTGPERLWVGQHGYCLHRSSEPVSGLRRRSRMCAARCAPSPARSSQPPRRLNGRHNCCVAGDRLWAVMFAIARAAKRADLSHRKTSCLQEWAAKKPWLTTRARLSARAFEPVKQTPSNET